MISNSSTAFKQRNAITGRIGLALLISLLIPLATQACSIPVFRYALERWAPAPYELLVFHQGALSPEQQSIVSTAAQSGQPDDDRQANVRVRTVNLAEEIPADLAELANQQKGQALPTMLLRNPRGSAVEAVIWKGPFDADTIRKVVQSPARTEIARRLLKGESAVWVLLESGQKAQDDNAADILTRRLATLEKTLSLPKIEPDDIVKHQITAAIDELRVAFSVVRVDRTDPLEAVFVRMLLNTEDDLLDIKEPMAFPVFGRGRALFALVGKGISRETIDEACAFVIGPCSCVVKELNPGQDLLLAADWGSVPQTSIPEDGHSHVKPGTPVPIAPGLPETSDAPPAAPATQAKVAVAMPGLALAGVAVLVLVIVGGCLVIARKS